MFKVAHSLGHRAVAMLCQQSRYPSRNIFTANAIGMPKLEHLMSSKARQFDQESRQRYIERMTSYLHSGDAKSIYREDLVNLTGIAETQDDLDLIERIVEAIMPEQGTFLRGWGAPIMRLYYKMGQTERAYNNLKERERFGDFFNIQTCYKTAMAMLYDKGEYQKIVDLYRCYVDRMETSQMGSSTYPNARYEQPSRDIVLLTIAALAKTGTPEALQEAKTILAERNDEKRFTPLRPACLISYLALKNGDYGYVLNVVSSIGRRYVVLRDLKIIALFHSGRHADVLTLMREYQDQSKSTNVRLLKSTYEELMSGIDKVGDVATRQELDDILVEMKEGNHVSEESLEDIIYRPIDKDPSERRNQTDDSRQDGRAPRDQPGPWRRSYRAEDSMRQSYNAEEDSNRPRGERRTGGQRFDRGFKFQNVNFET